MPVYRPNAIVRVNVPNIGTPSQRVVQESTDDVFTVDVRVFQIRLASNNHNEADEVELHGEIDDIGLDPRLLRDCEVYVYLGFEDATGAFVANNQTLRFVGIAVEIERIISESGGKSVRIRALDYTTLFINAKKYPASRVPTYSMTLIDAWNLICDNTGYFNLDASGTSGTVESTVQRLKSDGTGSSTDRLVFVGEAAASRVITLGTAVSERLASLGKLEVQHGADAWAVWQTVVGSLGLISFIRGDRCIVTTATDFYTGDDPPRFILGQNIVSMTETRNAQSLSTKNVAVFAFDPLSHKTVEAYWPPRSLVKDSKKIAASAKGDTEAVKANDYDIFDCPFGITDPDTLTKFARMVWEQRTRQEIAGEIKVVHAQVPTLRGLDFDVLSLQAGDRIRVELEPAGLESATPGAVATTGAGLIYQRQQALMARGYGAQPALFLAENMDGLADLTPEFQVHSVEVELDTQQGESPRFEITIHFVNRINVSGSADAGDGESVSAVSNQSKIVQSSTRGAGQPASAPNARQRFAAALGAAAPSQRPAIIDAAVKAGVEFQP